MTGSRKKPPYEITEITRIALTEATRRDLIQALADAKKIMSRRIAEMIVDKFDIEVAVLDQPEGSPFDENKIMAVRLREKGGDTVI